MTSSLCLIYLLLPVSIERWIRYVAKMGDWHNIKFKPNSHRLAKRNLHRQGLEAFLLMQQTIRRKGSRVVSGLKLLFYRYMFGGLASDMAPWRKINSKIGASRLVGFERKQTTLPSTSLCTNAVMRSLRNIAVAKSSS